MLTDRCRDAEQTSQRRLIRYSVAVKNEGLAVSLLAAGWPFLRSGAHRTAHPPVTESGEAEQLAVGIRAVSRNRQAPGGYDTTALAIQNGCEHRLRRAIELATAVRVGWASSAEAPRFDNIEASRCRYLNGVCASTAGTSDALGRGRHPARAPSARSEAPSDCLRRNGGVLEPARVSSTAWRGLVLVYPP